MDDIAPSAVNEDRLSPAEEPTELDAPGAVPGEAQPLSKNALKRAAKAERLAVVKLERRAREKEAKKEKKRVLALKRAAGELDEEDAEKTRRSKKPRIHWGGKVVVDLGFDEMMSEKEIKSLCSQLAYTYSANRNAAYPFSLIYTSLNGRTFAHLESMGNASYKRWANTQWWTEGYDRLWVAEGTSTTQPTSNEEGNEVQTATETQPSVNEANSNPETFQKNVVYLTADSEEELTELKPDETYIIGGICDHNRYKNLCFNKAKETGVRSARLPIGRYLASLPTRKVLTVNQVFEILLKWVETKDWEEALYAVIPKRKFQTGGKGSTSQAAGKDGEEVADTGEGTSIIDAESIPALVEPEQENP